MKLKNTLFSLAASIIAVVAGAAVLAVTFVAVTFVAGDLGNIAADITDAAAIAIAVAVGMAAIAVGIFAAEKKFGFELNVYLFIVGLIAACCMLFVAIAAIG